MLTIAFVLAILYTAAYAILFQKLPLRIRAWLFRRDVLLDIVLSISVLTALSFTLTGIIAAALVALFVSAYLWWYKTFQRDKDNEQIAQLKKTQTPLLVRLGARVYNFFRA